jgi:hypothetical protein
LLVRITSALLLLTTLAACTGDDDVTLTVDLRTDFAFGDEFTRVETLLASEPITTTTETRRVEATGLEGADLVGGHRIAELGDVGKGTRFIRVRLLDASGVAVIARDAVVELEANTSITVVVSRRCTGLVCPAAGDPETHTACAAGSCVDPRCTPETPELCGDPECSADAECAGATGCLSASCVEGTCFVAPDDSLCGGGERCDAAGACVGAMIMDSSVPTDTRPPVIDSGMDTAVDTRPPLSANFCPSDPLLREEMAVFLVRFIHGTDFTPPPATGTFSDVPAGSFFAPWIEQLQRDGVTDGCMVGVYCPSDPVVRDQAAVFFLRAIHGGSYMPPAASGTVFSDVSVSTTFAAYIEQLEGEGITNGCGGGRYCPLDDLTREQAAVSIVRMDRGPSFVPPPAVGLFDDVPASAVLAPFIEQFALDGYTDGCVR